MRNADLAFRRCRKAAPWRRTALQTASHAVLAALTACLAMRWTGLGRMMSRARIALSYEVVFTAIRNCEDQASLKPADLAQVTPSGW
jgi:hypothetical protein